MLLVMSRFCTCFAVKPNKWSEGEVSIDRCAWEILFGFYRIASSICKLEMSSSGSCSGCNMLSTGFCHGDCNTLQYMLVPQVLPTILSTFVNHSKCDFKRHSVLMTSLLELVSRCQYVQRRHNQTRIICQHYVN